MIKDEVIKDVLLKKKEKIAAIEIFIEECVEWLRKKNKNC